LSCSWCSSRALRSVSCPCTLLLSCCLVFLVEIAFGLTLGFFVQSDEATGVVPFVVFILVWRMPFGLAQSWFAQSAEVVAVALEPCSRPWSTVSLRSGREMSSALQSGAVVITWWWYWQPKLVSVSPMVGFCESRMLSKMVAHEWVFPSQCRSLRRFVVLGS
jgi:hypothetical protein